MTVFVTERITTQADNLSAVVDDGFVAVACGSKTLIDSMDLSDVDELLEILAAARGRIAGHIRYAGGAK